MKRSTLIRLPEISELQAFVVAAQEGSFAATARRLQLTGPAIAKRIGNLEVITQLRLFERSEGGVELTPDGRAFLDRATKVLRNIEELVSSGAETLRISGIQELIGQRSRLDSDERLHNTEALFARIFHGSPDAIVISRLSESVVIDANQSFCSLTGFSREEVLGNGNLVERVWGGWEARTRVMTRVREEGSVSGRGRLERRNGELLDFKYVAQAIEVQEQEVLLMRLEARPEAALCNRPDRRRTR